jgi:hypothetical protein
MELFLCILHNTWHTVSIIPNHPLYDEGVDARITLLSP